MKNATFAVERLENEKWFIQAVKEGDLDDPNVKHVILSAYLKAIEWDITKPVRVLAYTDDHPKPALIMQHKPYHYINR